MLWLSRDRPLGRLWAGLVGIRAPNAIVQIREEVKVEEDCLILDIPEGVRGASRRPVGVADMRRRGRCGPRPGRFEQQGRARAALHWQAEIGQFDSLTTTPASANSFDI